LGETFLLERELRGGMSRVFIAREKALGRTVVLKVLPPELAAGLSADRFRREIQVAANLQHSHIVPLLSTAEAGGFLYYTMPYIKGESLRERLARQGELPVHTATRILEQVTRALSYAHRHGVIHRDIKPDNILLSESEALVADFGIAKAITASVEHGGFTSTGVALGTPQYMAPEQGAADPTTDARADLYALGVVAYEMLAGQPPFQGRSAAHLLAAHATERPVPLRERRPAVPVALADMVMRLLEKRPADRPQQADELLPILEMSQARTPEPVTTIRVAHSTTSISHRRRWLAAGVVATLAVVVLMAWLTHRQSPVKVDRSVIAVTPFRVTGADSSLGYLREGMVDLLAAKLSGTAGIRAVDPRSLLASWQQVATKARNPSEDDAIGVAEGLGAGRLIQGEVVGTGQQITISADVLDVSSGVPGARASVEGSPDSLPRLVDRLAGKLLALEAGEGEQRLANLTSTSLPALRAYLEGQALVRRGAFRHAADKFGLALQQDSTFALAGLGLTRAEVWFGKQPAENRGALLAWRYRDRLAPPDRALLEVDLGPHWPAPSSLRDAISAAQRFVQMAPDNAEAWQELGDNLYHFGGLVDIPDAVQRASQAFGKALALDSSFAPALEHGTTLALILGDTIAAKKADERMLRVDSASGYGASDRWLLAVSLGDTARQKATRRDSLMGGFMMSGAMTLGVPLQDADAVLRANLARFIQPDDQAALQRLAHVNSVITGWPSRAIPLPSAIPERVRLATVYLEGQFAEGDSATAASAGPALQAVIGTPLAPTPDAAFARFAGGESALRQGRFDLVQRAVADLRRVRVPPDSAWLREVPAGFALLLDAELAGKQRSLDLPKLLPQIDSALTNASFMPFLAVGNLIVSRLYEQQGDLPRALAAIRRRVVDLASGRLFALYVTYHREEGRLAALNGDRDGAIRAYRRYLALRSGAEPKLQRQVTQVRAELEALERESTDK
jgi:tetratricopeptide (TPR) repeat protein/TolB-like protein